MSTSSHSQNNFRPSLGWRCGYVCSLVSILWITVLISAQAAVIDLPVGERVLDFEYDWQYRQVISAGTLYDLSMVGPFGMDRFENLKRPAMRLLEEPSTDQLRLIGLTSGLLHAADDARTDRFYTFSGGLRYSMSNSFGAFARFELDREDALDPGYSGIKWRGLAGRMRTAAIYFTRPSVSVVLGRQRIFWGPQPVNLALSSTMEPLDMLGLKYRRGRLEFSFVLARLSGSQPDSLDLERYSDFDNSENRYLSGHRLDLRLRNNLRLGFYELTLFGGPGRSPELYYLNPLQLFHAIQLNEQVDDNTFLGFDFAWLPKPRYYLYGQLLIDDYQIDSEDQSDQEPNEIGLMAGLIRTGKVGRLEPDIKAEYVRITNRTYHQRLPRNRFLHENQLLGHPLGPDADSLSLKFSFRPTVDQVVQLEVALRRKGEGSIYNAWDEPWLSTDGNFSERFPTGLVEKSTRLAVRYGGYLPLGQYLKEHMFLMITAGYESTKNSNHMAGGAEPSYRLTAELTWLGGLEIDIGE